MQARGSGAYRAQMPAIAGFRKSFGQHPPPPGFPPNYPVGARSFSCSAAARPSWSRRHCVLLFVGPRDGEARWHVSHP